MPDARKVLEARLERFHEPFLEVDEVRPPPPRGHALPAGPGVAGGAARGGGRVPAPRRPDLGPRRLGGGAAKRSACGVESGSGCGREMAAPKVPIKPGPKQIPQAEIDAVIDDGGRSEDRGAGRAAPAPAGQPAPRRGQPGGAGRVAARGSARATGLPYTFRGVERTKKKAGKLPPYDLLVRERREPDGREVTTGVLFVTNVGLSATARAETPAGGRQAARPPPAGHRPRAPAAEGRGPGGRVLPRPGEARPRAVRAPQDRLRAVRGARRPAGRRRHGPVGRPGDRGAPRDAPPRLRGGGGRLAPSQGPVPQPPAAATAADRRAAAGRWPWRPRSSRSTRRTCGSTSWPSSPG